MLYMQSQVHSRLAETVRHQVHFLSASVNTMPVSWNFQAQGRQFLYVVGHNAKLADTGIKQVMGCIAPFMLFKPMPFSCDSQPNSSELC